MIWIIFELFDLRVSFFFNGLYLDYMILEFQFCFLMDYIWII
jgi:hypothetical protein